MITRSGLDWTHRMPQIAAALAELPVDDALLDGEVVVFDDEGKTSFADLQAAFQEGKKKPLTYVIFDLLHLNGHNLRSLPLEQRKNILEKILVHVVDGDHHGVLRYSEHLGTRGGEIFEKACQLGAEGIVSKKASAPYSSGRSGNWLKIKCVRQQEFVIGGFTPPSKIRRRHRRSAAGLLPRRRTGICGPHRHRVYAERASANAQAAGGNSSAASPFSSVPPDGARDAQWVQPKYVCEVKFATWTADNLVRQASFQGLREDKPAKQVTRELPVEPGGKRSLRGKRHPRAHRQVARTKKIARPVSRPEAIAPVEPQRTRSPPKRTQESPATQTIIFQFR